MNEQTITTGALAAAAGVSKHTVRYYDDAGLIPGVGRNPAGHRRFRQDHVAWIGLLLRLRASGMSVARMREYARLAARGDETFADRRDLLERHAADIRGRIDELQTSLAIVNAKIGLYDGRLTDKSVIWRMVAEASKRPGPPQTSSGA